MSYLTDLGSLVTTYAPILAAIGLVLATAVLALHTSHLVKATNGLAQVQAMPRLALAEPIRIARVDEGSPKAPQYYQPSEGPSYIVQVINLGFGTAFEARVTTRNRDVAGGELIANPFAPNLDIPPNEVRKSRLPHLPDKFVILAKYRDLQGKEYETALTWEGDFRMAGSLWQKPSS